MTATKQTKRKRTFLKLPKNNTGAVVGAAGTALIVGILELVASQLKDGTLPVPHAVVPYIPLIAGVLGLLVIFVGNLGTPHLNPGEGE